MGIIQPIKPPRTDDPKELDRFLRDMALRQGYLTNDGDPAGTVIPRWVGDRLLDYTNSDWYMAVGMTAADWKALT